MKKFIGFAILVFANDILFPLHAHACFGCLIIPSSGRFNFIGYLFWTSIAYWCIMAINQFIFRCIKKALPYDEPKSNKPIIILCIVLTPFTLGAALVFLSIISCAMETMKHIAKTSVYMKGKAYLKAFVLLQWATLIILVTIFIFQPSLHS